MFPTAQGGADVEAIAHAVLARKRRPHPVALVVEKLAFEQSAALREFRTAPDVVLLEQILHPVKGGSVEDCRVLSLEPFAAMVGLAEVDAIFEEIGEGTVGEGNAALIFGDLGIASLGDDAPSVEFGNQLAERSQFKIKLEDGPNGLGFGLVDDELLVLGVIAKRNGAARPFALSCGRRPPCP